MGIVGLELHTLSQIHERFVDFAGLSESGAGGFGSTSTLGACELITD